MCESWNNKKSGEIRPGLPLTTGSNNKSSGLPGAWIPVASYHMLLDVSAMHAQISPVHRKLLESAESLCCWNLISCPDRSQIE